MKSKRIAQKSKGIREYKKLAKMLDRLYSDFPIDTKVSMNGNHIHGIFSNQVLSSLQNGENTQ